MLLSQELRGARPRIGMALEGIPFAPGIPTVQSVAGIYFLFNTSVLKFSPMNLGVFYFASGENLKLTHPQNIIWELLLGGGKSVLEKSPEQL